MNYINQDDELENESGLPEPDEFDILQELYTQERMANDFLIERLKALASAQPEEALQGIRDILTDGYAYFGEQRPWDRPSITSLLPNNQQLDLF
jgi:methionyl-tRNA synthetase